MTNNCLVTKLKGVVDNPNLPKFGEISFKIIKNMRRTIYLSVLKDITLTVTGGLFKDSYDASSGVTTVKALANQSNAFSVVTNEGIDAIIKISNKYAIKELSFGGYTEDPLENGAVELDANLLCYSPLENNLQLMMSKGISGNLSNILKNQVNVTNIDIYNTNISGTTEELANIIPASQLLSLSTSMSNFTGSINNLAKFVNIRSIIGGEISGTIEEFGPLFLAACIEQGVSQADITIREVAVTYQGNPILLGNSHLIVSNGSWSFTLG